MQKHTIILYPLNSLNQLQKKLKLHGGKLNSDPLIYCMSAGLRMIFEAKKVVLNSSLF